MMTESTSTEPQSGTIKFVQHFLPPLQSGKYTVELQQKVTINNEEKFYKATSRFSVQGERFNLQPSDIKSVFPPNNSQGNFTGVLPHIVFTRKVLPWEWTINGGPQQPQPNGNVTPWMALLVFNEQDPIPDEQPSTLADLKKDKLPSRIISYSEFIDSNSTSKFYPGESPEDPISIIDIPIDLFNRIAPSIEDLTYLAHSRIVSSNKKKAENMENRSNEYSVIVANRLPHGKTTVVHLVNLEGMGQYLPNSDGKPSEKITADIKFIRLVSLKSWSFTAIEDKYDFAGLLQKLLPIPLHLPYQKKDTKDTKDTNDTESLIKNALSMGYVPLNHYTRLGDETISWYRSPLVPYAIPENIETPITCADAIAYYDPETGLFDQSYAAAWQLGRLLALNNREFAVSLHKWRRENQRQTVDSLEQDILKEPLDKILLEINQQQSSQDTSAMLPEIITTFLGRLQLLYDVPFNYLVPHEKLLPVESIRFFQVDFNWIRCLVDGAYSIGRSTTRDMAHDGAQGETIHNSAHDSASVLRSAIMEANTTETVGTKARVMSGFLLRSQVVSAYPGLEVDGIGDQLVKLSILRFERLFPDVLLCLFAGEIKELRVHQPPEGLHFGVNTPWQLGKPKKLRDLQGKELSDSVDVPFRDVNSRVIKIDAWAGNLKRKLQDTNYTSAEFALQLVEGVQQVIFNNKL